MTRVETNLMTGWEFTLQEPNDHNFKPIHLPHDWAIHAPINRTMVQGEAQGFRDRWGIGWYRRHIALKELREGYVYQLQFDGVYENSTVWVNGNEAGGQKYGYSRFTLDITDHIHEGDNVILVKVDNTSFPADRWYSGAGIYRTVKVLELNENHLKPEEIQVKTEIHGDVGIVTIATGVTSLVKAVISDESSRIVGESDNGLIKVEIPNVKLWSPDQPHLYQLDLSLFEGDSLLDTYELRIGVREIELIADKGMFINGNLTKIKGLCIHQDASCLGIAVPPEIWRERFVKFKAMGCNAIRTAHHMPASEILDLCDELGLLVYEEPFDKWTGGSYRRYFETEWKNDLTCMVKRDRNHPSIFIWGVGNEVENQGQASMIAILKMLKEHLLTLDDTRPVSYAMNPHFKYESNVDLSQVKDIQQFVDEVSDTEIYNLEDRIERIRRIAEHVDVLSCNYQEQWYPAIHAAMPDKLILGSETYQFFRGHPDQMQNFSDEVPWMDVENHDYVIGGMLWTGIDYLGESMGYPAKGWAGSLFSTNNERKPLSYLYESYWSEKPMVYLAVMDYSLQDEGAKQHWDTPRYASHWNFPQFNKTVIPYMIASNCDEVTLELNGKQFYVEKPSAYPNRMITGYLPYLPGTITVRGFHDGEETCQYTLTTAGPTVKLAFETDDLRLEAKEGYQQLFTVRAKDKEGNPVFRESSKVTFKITGPAEIVGVDNGDLCSSETYDNHWIHMYRGCVSTIIRLTGEKGRVVLSAFSEGMFAADLVIDVV
ncbi:glycoside hydrolase family 2 TIM barrel-domain containing protein [Paenibacillus qinlingensis]|uniref:glycoside hydrolase family 2 TIM barrel-domain containing protein n=1 Tax=Paenibacillus qinlingensis TaxID=1837343 RepID=UPI001566BD1B|nr:glycoside hydrolase family 2 TIM barrel-domain containing protein [Paenibacillus qinlingensis]NQX61087.1 glycoside hydrolase family 2 protein [Paenibacillus qinlingensis]